MNRDFAIHKLALALIALLLVTGCEKRHPNVPPAAAEAPAITIPSPFPPEPAATETTTAPAATAQPEPAQPEEVPSATKPKAKHANHSAKTPSKNPGKVVVEEGGDSEPPAQAISAGMDQSEAAHERQVTEQLLQSTDSNLKA